MPGELILQCRPRVRVTFEPLASWDPSHRLVLEDELRLAVAEARGETGIELQAEVVAGRYRVVRMQGDEELGSAWADVDSNDQRLPAP
jgi:hypothetical protein